jgi:hypothetical protein
MCKRVLLVLGFAVALAGCGGPSAKSMVTNVPGPPTDLGGGATPVADGGVPIVAHDGGVVTTGSDGGSMPGDLGPPADMTPPVGPPAWRLETSGVSGNLVGVYAGAGDAWAVGQAGTLLHKSGDGSWSAVPTGDSEDFTAVWGQGANDIFVTDATGATLHSSDGATFVAMGTTAAAPTYLFGGGDLIYVNTASPSGPTLYRSLDHGATFTPLSLAASGFPGALAVGDFALWGDAVSLFGASCVVQTNCQAFRSDDGGTTWSARPMPSGAGTVDAFYYRSFSVGDRVYVLYQMNPGDYDPGPNHSTIMVSTDRGQSFAVGSTMAHPVDKLWVAATGDIVAIGPAGMVGQGSGASFAETAVPTGADLNAVWGSAADDVYIVGNGGVILHYRR